MVPALLAVALAFAVPTSPPRVAAGGFIESPLKPGVYLRVPDGAAAPAFGAPKASPVRSISGILDAGAVIRAGNTLYVGNNQDRTTNLISVVDVTTPGAEVITGTIATPVNPVDFAVVGSNIYVVDQTRNAVHRRALSGGAWTALPLPNGVITEWTYGDIIYPDPAGARLFVIHMWEDLIDVIDVASFSVTSTISNLHHLPNRIVFAGGRMVVLGVGLSAPSCLATGPHFAVFNATTLVKQYEVAMTGACPQTVLANSAHVYAFRDSDVKRYLLSSGALVNAFAGAFGRHAALNGRELYSQDFTGSVSAIDLGLVSIDETVNVLAGFQVWFPPIEEMVAMGPCDGRLFVTNRNDDSLSIVDFPKDCFPYGFGVGGILGAPVLAGKGCPAAGGVLTLKVSNAFPNSTMLLFAGTGKANLPLGGGAQFLVSPLLPPVAALPIDGTGSLTLPIALPPSVPVGLVATLQMIGADPTALVGFGTTNGLRLMLE